MRRLPSLLSLTLAQLFVLLQTARPCEVICTRLGARDALQAYRYVLVGKVVEVHWDGPQGSFVVQPVRVWKGKWPGDKKRFRITTYGGSASCGYPLLEGSFYIIYASEEPQHIAECDHEPQPLHAALKEVATVGRQEELTPLRQQN